MDGLIHMFGLRTDNAWFDTLTGGVFGSFSVGDTVGTLNWWLRIVTGILFGVAAVACSASPGWTAPWPRSAPPGPAAASCPPRPRPARRRLAHQREHPYVLRRNPL